MLTLNLQARVEGALLGLLIGDALGVPYEFHPPETIPPKDLTEYAPPKTFMRAHSGVPPATWSDDGAQALCLLASLLYRNTLDVEDFGRRLQNWYDVGYMAVDGYVFDIGITTREAVDTLRAGRPAAEAGIDDEYANGNGSLMRVLPLALWHQGSDDDLVRDAQLQSCVTHRHVRSQVCCALYCLWARYLLCETPNAWESAVTALRRILEDDAVRIEELERHILKPRTPTGSGYVVDCLHSARAALSVDFESTVKNAVAFGNDADTTACVAGGIAGLIFGVDSIPQRWKDGLRGQDLYTPLLEALLQRVERRV